MQSITRLVVSVVFLLTLSFAVSAGRIPDISQEELASAVAAKTVVVLDVNGSASFKTGHIPGAIDYIANKDRLKELLPADKSTLIVGYCYGPKCGAYAAAINAVLDLGYTNVKHYAPGISGWKASGEPVESVAQ